MINEEPRGELTVRVVAMPADTNPYGDIFGGWVLSQMDLAGGIAASNCCGGRAVTAAVQSMSFLRPVKVGDILCVYTEIEKVGRSSIRIVVECWARRWLTDLREKVTEAEFVFVAVDRNGRPEAIKGSESQSAGG